MLVLILLQRGGSLDALRARSYQTVVTLKQRLGVVFHEKGVSRRDALRRPVDLSTLENLKFQELGTDDGVFGARFSAWAESPQGPMGVSVSLDYESQTSRVVCRLPPGLPNEEASQLLCDLVDSPDAVCWLSPADLDYADDGVCEVSWRLASPYAHFGEEGHLRTEGFPFHLPSREILHAAQPRLAVEALEVLFYG